MAVDTVALLFAHRRWSRAGERCWWVHDSETWFRNVGGNNDDVARIVRWAPQFPIHDWNGCGSYPWRRLRKFSNVSFCCFVWKWLLVLYSWCLGGIGFRLTMTTEVQHLVGCPMHFYESIGFSICLSLVVQHHTFGCRSFSNLSVICVVRWFSPSSTISRTSVHEFNGWIVTLSCLPLSLSHSPIWAAGLKIRDPKPKCLLSVILARTDRWP